MSIGVLAIAWFGGLLIGLGTEKTKFEDKCINQKPIVIKDTVYKCKGKKL